MMTAVPVGLPFIPYFKWDFAPFLKQRWGLKPGVRISSLQELITRAAAPLFYPRKQRKGRK